MRIGIDVSPLTRVRTGVGNYTYYLLKHLLREAGDRTFHALSSGLGGVDLDGLDGLAAHRRLRLPTRALYKLWSTCGRPRADRLLGGVDVFHATNYFLPPAAPAKRVLTIYDLAFLRRPDWCNPRVVAPFAEALPRFAREADAILTCSEAAKRDIVELLEVPEHKVSVAYGAVDDSFAPMSRAAAERSLERYGLRPPFILCVGASGPRKNVTGLLRAFARVSRDVPHTLVLAGGGGAELDSAVSRLGLADRVRRIGYVTPHADLPAFYSAADMFVLPSFYEGFGLPVLEAMTCGCPVVVSNSSSLPEVAGDAAVYVDPHDAVGMAATITDLLADDGLRAAMSDKGRARAREFSWQACAQATLAVYESLV